MFFSNYQYFKNKETFILTLLILFSIFIRIPVIFQFGDLSLEHEWKILVNNLILHGTLSFRNLDGFLLPNLFMPPLYAFYLYFFSIFNLVEQNYILLILFSQILLSSISVAFFYKTNKFFFSQKISFYSALVFSFFPLHMYACSQISSITLQSFLLILFFYFFISFIKKNKTFSIIMFAALGGLLILLRGEFILIFIFSLFYLFFIFKTSFKNILLIFLIALITISPYLTRNILIFKQITITKSFGYNLWKGNNPNSKVEGYEVVGNELQEKINEVPKDKFYQINLDKIFFNQAIENIKTEPMSYLILYFKKFTSFLFIDLKSSYPNYYHVLHYLPILLIGATSLIGIIISDKRSKELNYLILIFFISVIIFSCFFILPRYKLSLIPFQLIFTNILFVYIYKLFYRNNE